MKCKDRETGQIIFPIFYHVDPFDVRKQKRKYEEAFSKYEQSVDNKNKVESWKKALVDASNIAGWEPKHVANGHEAKCIREIVDSILVKLSSLESAVEDEDLVGMGTRLKDLKRVLKIGSGGVRMVGIWGLGGGGKTTLATSIYMELKISGEFDGYCFVENIREESKQQNGLKSLQEKILSAIFEKKMQVESVYIGKRSTIKGMLCRRNVLIVLDDVDDLKQLEALAGRHDWFGDGSRIIITTRNEQVLNRVDEVYPVSLLSRDEAIRLFRKHAYHADKPFSVQDYEKLSSRVISYVNGLPLALKILGSFLYGKDKDEWLSTLARLKDHPEMDIVETLKISYDGLKPVEKQLFLDIACFFRRVSKDYAMKILDACGFHPCIGIKVLKQKALISVSSDGKFDMHDLVQEMAHYIVRGEHPYNPEKHSRVWRNNDIEDMCARTATTENDKIEAISVYNICTSDFIMLVSNMKKLRFIEVATWFKRNYNEGPSFLSNELRYIRWTGYPASPFPENFRLTKLAVLKMERSLQKELWTGYKYLPCLKVLKLSLMKALVRTPDIGGLPCLQKLTFAECESLEEVHPSLGNHKSLVSVKLRSCDKLTRFPSIVGMEKLEILNIRNCNALFPRIEAKTDNLVELYFTNLISLKVKWCSKLKSNFQALKGLKNFELNDCKQLEKLPKDDLFNKNVDEKLNLGWCGLKDGDIPNEIVELSNLQELHLNCNNITRLDLKLSRLTRLKLLELTGCLNLVELPELPSSLAILKANWCGSLEDVIRDEIHTNCKWLSQVSIREGSKNIIGGERLLETMLQGNVVESGCIRLQLQGLEIARGFEPRLVKGGRCGMQLPSNWFHHFSGFLICTVSNYNFDGTTISMKHDEEEKNGGWMGMGDSQHDDLYWEEDSDDDDDDDGSRYTWVAYIPFSLLRHTSWWNPTSTAIQIEMGPYNIIRGGCGLKLVPKRGGAESSNRGRMETTTTHSSEISLLDDHYKCKFKIQHDSKSDLKCSFDRFDWW